jgi:hypothetical protein
MAWFLTEDEKHRIHVHPFMLHDWKMCAAENRQLMDKIAAQESSVKANREMYRIAERVVREQSKEIETLKEKIKFLEDIVDVYEQNAF